MPDPRQEPAAAGLGPTPLSVVVPAPRAPLRRLWWATEPPVALTSLDDLERRLDALHELARDDEFPLVVTLVLGERDTDGVFWPPTLTLAVGREWSSLTYDDSRLPEVNFVSIGDASLANDDPDDDFPCAWGDDYTWPRAQNLVPVEHAREAVRQLWGTGARPTVCDWD